MVQEEVLFRFEAAGGDKSAGVEGANSPSIVVINVSPVEYGHVLLIPHVLDCLPQRIDHENLLVALRMPAEAGSPYFRLGYNSLGAFATVNHLHFQAYYLAVPFPVEKAPTEKIAITKGHSRSGVRVSLLMSYPARGLVYEGGNNLKDLADMVAKSCIRLQINDMPFNLLISDSGRRVFLFSQCSAEKQALGEVSQELLDTRVNPAVWEISGPIVQKRRKHQRTMFGGSWLRPPSPRKGFKKLKTYILEAVGLVKSDEHKILSIKMEEKHWSPRPQSSLLLLPQGFLPGSPVRWINPKTLISK